MKRETLVEPPCFYAKINKKLCQYLENETGCIDINFDTITDYIILIVFL